MNYLQWNDCIAKHFFNEEMAGREVLLFVTESLVQKLGQGQKNVVSDFSFPTARGFRILNTGRLGHLLPEVSYLYYEL